MPTPPNPHLPTNLSPGQTLRIDAACVADATTHHAPGTLILQRDTQTKATEPIGWTVLHAGPTHSLTSDRLAQIRDLAQIDAGFPTRILSLPTSTILPPFVNAHTHLDLTAMGPRPHDPKQGFATWLSMVRDQRPTNDAAIRAAVDRGIALSLAGGVVAVGDIAGYPGRFSLEPFHAMQTAGMLGVSFLEFFAIGSMQQGRLNELKQALRDHAELFNRTDPGHARLGLQPHAPYSVSLDAYQQLAQLIPSHVPRSTHLAETAAEHEFVARATGPHRAFLESLGLWQDSLLQTLAQGKTPVEHLAQVLESSPTPWLIAHANDCSDTDIQTLAHTASAVAYCPRAHHYFGHGVTLGPHRWRDMLDAGINVCLATDSIVNLNTPDRISPLDDARLVYRQSLEGADAGSGPAADPATLLQMITTNPAKALGLDPSRFTLAKGARPLAIVEIQGADSLISVTRSETAPRLLR